MFLKKSREEIKKMVMNKLWNAGKYTLAGLGFLFSVANTNVAEARDAPRPRVESELVYEDHVCTRALGADARCLDVSSLDLRALPEGAFVEDKCITDKFNRQNYNIVCVDTSKVGNGEELRQLGERLDSTNNRVNGIEESVGGHGKSIQGLGDQLDQLEDTMTCYGKTLDDVQQKAEEAYRDTLKNRNVMERLNSRYGTFTLDLLDGCKPLYEKVEGMEKEIISLEEESFKNLLDYRSAITNYESAVTVKLLELLGADLDSETSERMVVKARRSADEEIRTLKRISRALQTRGGFSGINDAQFRALYQNPNTELIFNPEGFKEIFGREFRAVFEKEGVVEAFEEEAQLVNEAKLAYRTSLRDWSERKTGLENFMTTLRANTTRYGLCSEGPQRHNYGLVEGGFSLIPGADSTQVNLDLSAAYMFQVGDLTDETGLALGPYISVGIPLRRNAQDADAVERSSQTIPGVNGVESKERRISVTELLSAGLRLDYRFAENWSVTGKAGLTINNVNERTQYNFAGQTDLTSDKGIEVNGEFSAGINYHLDNLRLGVGAEFNGAKMTPRKYRGTNVFINIGCEF
jgi:hypothetical protein